MKLLLLIFLIPLATSGQHKIDFTNYASVWIENDLQKKTGEWDLLAEHASINTNHSEGLSIYIPASNNVVKRFENHYILGYLINNSNDTLLVNRCDATICPAETQILMGNE